VSGSQYLMRNILVLKVDVDTLTGTIKGIPALIELFDKYKIKGTFYVSLGPDNTGKKILDVFKKGFLQKAARTNAVKIYGLKNLMYGFLLPAPQIHKKATGQLKLLSDKNFESGVHSYDHVYWHQNLELLDAAEIRNILNASSEIYYTIYNRRPETFAAPGWTVSAEYFKVIDSFKLKYLSDTRGYRPFYPVIDNYQSSTLQIPTTLFTLDELLGLKSDDEIIDYYVGEISNNDFNAMTIHTELEGGAFKNLFEIIIQKLLSKNIIITDLKGYYENFLNSSDISVSECKMDYTAGRAIKTALQLK